MNIILLGFDGADAARLAELLGSGIEVSLTSEANADLVCLGPGLSGRDALNVLEQHPHIRSIVLAAGREPEIFQDFIDSDVIYFLSRRPPPLDEVAALLRSALAHDERQKRLDRVNTAERGALVVARAIARDVDRIATETDIERI